MPRKIKPMKITWKYIRDESPVKQKESEEAVEHVYFSLFKQARENILKRRKT
jgi:hypothetical protein